MLIAPLPLLETEPLEFSLVPDCLARDCLSQVLVGGVRVEVMPTASWSCPLPALSLLSQAATRKWY